MKQFTELYLRLDQSNATNDKVDAMVDYFEAAHPADSAWAIWFLSGRRLKRLLKRANLKRWALEASNHPEWMLAEAYEAVGDLAETIALLLPEPRGNETEDSSLRHWIEERLVPLGAADEVTQGLELKQWWATLSADQRFVLNKLLTGALRVGVSQRLVTRALARHLDLDQALIAHRLMGDWHPAPELLEFLRSGAGDFADDSLPYPFFLSAPLEAEVATLGSIEDWQAEWKWDGIRAQLIRRGGKVVLWSRGEERLDGRFPELEQAAQALPDGTVLDGEILAYEPATEAGTVQSPPDDQHPKKATDKNLNGGDSSNAERASDTASNAAPPAYTFAALQRRIGRKKPSAAMLANVPVDFMAYDLLEWAGDDWRQRPLRERRSQLETALADQSPPLRLSPTVAAPDWAQLTERRNESRDRGVEGFMLKARASTYGTGRQRGSWWKWKIDPLTVDAVLLYAQPGSGRRSNLLTDYTFGVWKDDELVTVCKAYSGLNNDEISELDRWIRTHTTERFGPVRAVEQQLVFEIAFEGIWPSKRHKAGVAFRFPRILRWRRDLDIHSADSLGYLQDLVAAETAAPSRAARAPSGTG